MTQAESFLDGFRLIDGTELNDKFANPEWSISSTFSATSGGTVVTSAKVATTITVVTSAAAGAGITIPQSLPGRILLIQNAAANYITVFAAKNSTIDGIPGSIGIQLLAGVTMMFVGTAPGQWSSSVIDQSVQTIVIPTIATLRNTPVGLGEFVTVEGYYVAGDGGGGQFIGAAGAAPGTYVDNGGTIIVPTGGNGSAAWLRPIAGFVNVLWFGAKADVITLYTTASIASGNNVLTVTGTAFTSADIGKSIQVQLAGAVGTSNTNLVSTITGVTNSTTVTLAANAVVTLTNTATWVAYGTNDTTAIQNAITLNAGEVKFANGTSFITQIVCANSNQYLSGDKHSTLKVINEQIAAVVVSGAYCKFENFDVDGSRYDANSSPGGEHCFFVTGQFNQFNSLTTYRAGRGFGFGPTIKSISSLTSATTTATAVTASPHGFSSGQTVNIEGASPSAYNGQYVVSVSNPTTFTYTFSGGTSPATGSPIASVSIKGNQVTNCRIGDMADIGISMSKHEEALVSANTVYLTGLEAVTVDVWSHKAKICENSVFFCCLSGGNGGLGWDGSNNVIVTDNYIENGSNPGIFVAAHVAATGVSGTASSTGGVVANNRINNSSGTGIVLEYFTGPNLGWGINHWPTAMVIEGNNVSTTGQTINVQSGVVGNTIGDNQWNTTPAITSNVKNYGAKGDGTTNDAAAIQAAVAQNSNVFFPPGTYLISSVITLNSVTGGTLTFAEGAIIKLGTFSGDASAFNINGNYWVITNATIDGSSAVSSSNILNGITIFGSYNTIQKCNIKNITGLPQNDGIWILAGNYNKIDNCILTNLGNSGISVQPNGLNVSTGNVITNNVINTTGSAGIPQTYANGTVIENNYISNCAAEGITADNGSTYCIISKNTINACASGGVGGIGTGWKSNSNQITDNIVTNTVLASAPYGNGIFVFGDRNIVARNQCYNNGGAGVRVHGGEAPTSLAISSLTSVSNTATATCSFYHFLVTGDTVTIAGATPSGYNLTATVTVVDKKTFTYTIVGPLSSPATGTITATYSATADVRYSKYNAIVDNYLYNNSAGGLMVSALTTAQTPTYVLNTSVGPDYAFGGVTDYSTSTIYMGGTKAVYDTNAGSDVSVNWVNQFNSSQGVGRILAGSASGIALVGGTMQNSSSKDIIAGALKFIAGTATAGSETASLQIGLKSAASSAFSNTVFTLDSAGNLTIPALFIANSGTPASSSAAGTKGQILYDSSYIYICVATNTWRRVATSSPF